MSGFFDFHQLMSTYIIKVTYIGGLLFISIVAFLEIALGIAGVIAITQESRLEGVPLPFANQPVLTLIVGVVTFVVGNLLWRLLCEAWILMFSMHELLASIARSLSGTVSGEVEMPGSIAYQRRIT